MNENNTKNLTASDYLLVLLYLNNKEPINGAIRLEKMMFIFVMEIKPIITKKGLKCDKIPYFFAYSFGPFSKDVYEQIDLFKTIGFVQVKDVLAKEDMIEVDDIISIENGGGSNNYLQELNGKNMKYTIGKNGCEFVEKEILPKLPTDVITILETFKSKITSLTPKSILRYVYTKYPEYTTKSLIKDEVFK